MSLASLHPPHETTPYKGRLVRCLNAVWATLEAIVSAQDRAREFTALSARTDEELAEMGLTRQTIVHHVFRDRAWL